MIEALRREIARDMARETVRDITLDPSVATVGGEILGQGLVVRIDSRVLRQAIT